MTAKEIINYWCNDVFRERRQNKVFPNVFFDGFEADILELTKSGYASEYEVKISRADFKNDSLKERNWYKGREVDLNKYIILKNGNRVNYFYYVVPKGLITVNEIPEFAGLIYVEEYEYKCFSMEKGNHVVMRMRSNVIKSAPKLCKDKFPVDRLFKCLESTYYRFHTQRMKMAKT